MNFNNQKLEIKKFHIDELPQDRIFVQFDGEFHKEIFSKIEKFRLKEFNQHFFNGTLSLSAFNLWRKRKSNLTNRIKEHFIPLWFVVKLSQIFSEYPIDKIEKRIIAMKGPSSAKVIYQPHLPLSEDERLIKIVAHLLGDGHVSGGFGTKLPKGKTHSEYRNFSNRLLDCFEKDLQVFGNLKASKDYVHGHVIIPNVIGYILEHLYQVKFDCFNSRVPYRICLLDRRLVAAFIRAYFDDEGHVYDSSIECYSNNKLLVNDVLKLINDKFPEIDTSEINSNPNAGKNIKYSFQIYNNSQENYLNLIGFDHPQKVEDLIFNIRRAKNWNNGFSPKKGRPKEKIIRALEKGEATAKQISRRLLIRHSCVLFYLRKLEKEGKVEIVRKERWANVWRKSDNISKY